MEPHVKIIDFEEGWDCMVKGISKLKRILEGLPRAFTSEEYMRILEGLPGAFTSEEYMTLYTTVYHMCTYPNDYSQQLLDKYKEEIDEYIRSTVLPSLREKNDVSMLRELVQRWSNHKIMLMWLSRFFRHLDRCLVTRSSPSLSAVGSSIFRDLVYIELRANARAAVITLIDKEREGEQIDRLLLKNIVDFFVEIGMGKMEQYAQDFEHQMLDATADYYKAKASNWIEAYSCPEYMMKAEESLKEERDRVSHYLHPSTEPKLIEKVQHELLVTHASQLLDNEHSGCHALLRDDKVEDLSRMYKLYHKIPKGLEPIVNIFKKHITDEGMVLVQQAEEAANNQTASGSSIQEQVLMRKIIELHDNYMEYVNGLYKDHKPFHKSLKEAFAIFCDRTVAGCSSAELLATFCDNVLKKGGSDKLSDEAIEETLDKAIRLLSYISDKDLFAEFYRKKLAHRLLFDRSANGDREKNILTELKQEYGGQFTSNMEGMVADLTLARDMQVSFENYLRDNKHVNPGIDLTVTVLTKRFWPSYKSFDLSLPPEMVKCVEVFKTFYKTTANHRKLIWIYSLDTCNVIGKFDQKPIELIVSTHQAATLLLFNTADRLNYSEIRTQLNLTPEDLDRLLHSLSCAKYKILIKDPNTKTISPTDSFEFNSKFTDRMRRIKISLPHAVGVTRKVIEDVVKDRRYAIDAAIVRIMKSSKVLGYNQLLIQCVDQLGRMFKPDIKAIKLRIEDLISRDYLERDKDNLNTIRYLT